MRKDAEPPSVDLPVHVGHPLVGSDALPSEVTRAPAAGVVAETLSRSRSRCTYLIRVAIVPPWFVKIRVPFGRWISVTNRLV